VNPIIITQDTFLLHDAMPVLSVTLIICGHIGRVTPKVITQIISLDRCSLEPWHESSSTKCCAIAKKPCDAAAVLFSSKFADNIHYKFKSSQASKARFQTSELQTYQSSKSKF